MNAESNFIPRSKTGFPAFGSVLAYGVLIAATIGLFIVINSIGSNLSGMIKSDHVPAASAPRPMNIFAHVLIALIVMVVACQLVGRLFRQVGQPAVIGEVVAGILLGPSFLGRLWPEASSFIMPREVRPFIDVIAQLGVILYMFIVGLELNPAVLRKRAGSVLLISHVGIAVPFVAGAALGLYLYPRYSQETVSFTSFALFMGIALSVTAFPVLARILTDRKMQTTPLGTTALAIAAVSDVTAWCMLAVIVGIARESMSDALVTLILTGVFITVMFTAIKPLVERLLRKYETATITPMICAVFLVAILTAALTTEAIGIHALFGAFLLGAILPHDHQLTQAFNSKIEDLVGVLFLPAFFASVGLRTEIGLVSGWQDWLICGVIIVIATAGKLGGTYIAARMSRINREDAAVLGVLMNTRGLMELIVLTIGLEMKVITPTIFVMMVLMALITTIATGPALWLLGSTPKR